MTLCIRSKTLPLIEQYLAVTGTAPSTFGRAAINAPNLLSDMRLGRQPREATAERLLAYMEGSLVERIANMEERIGSGQELGQ